MQLARRCESCGRPNPVFAVGNGPGVSPVHGYTEPPGVKPFRYIESRVCMSCRHATVMPGQLGPVVRAVPL